MLEEPTDIVGTITAWPEPVQREWCRSLAIQFLTHFSRVFIPEWTRTLTNGRETTSPNQRLQIGLTTRNCVTSHYLRLTTDANIAIARNQNRMSRNAFQNCIEVTIFTNAPIVFKTGIQRLWRRRECLKYVGSKCEKPLKKRHFSDKQNRIWSFFQRFLHKNSEKPCFCRIFRHSPIVI